MSPLLKPSLFVLSAVAILTTASLAIASPPTTKTSKPAPTSPLPKGTPLPSPTTTQSLDNSKLNPGATISTSPTATKLPQIEDTLDSSDLLPVWTKFEVAKHIQLDTSRLVTMTEINPTNGPQTWSSGMTVTSTFGNATSVSSSYRGRSDSAGLSIAARNVPSGRTLLLSCRVSITAEAEIGGAVVLTASGIRTSGDNKGLTGRATAVEAHYTPDRMTGGHRKGTATAHLVWTTQANEQVDFRVTTKGIRWDYTPGGCVLSEVSG
jgi:hypothetical protein